MLLFALAVAIGVGLGRVRGGSLRSLAGLRLRAPGVVALALGLQVVIGALGPGTRWGVAALMASYGLMGWWLLANLRNRPCVVRVGLGAVALGYALNVAAIVANGAMPVSVAALRAVGASAHAVDEGPNLAKHVAAGEGSMWSWLGDVVAVRPLRTVISAGDVAMAVGVVILICGAMGGGRRPFSEADGKVAHLSPTVA